MPPADWPTDVMLPVDAPPRPPLERVRAAAEAVMWMSGAVAMLAAAAILVLLFVIVLNAR